MQIKTYEDFQKEDRPIGIYSGIPNSVYHSHKAIGRSDLEKIAMSPLHWKHYKENPKEPSEAMKLGSAVHEYFLDPQAGEVVVMPNINRRTNTGKAEYEKFIEDNAENTVITPETHAAAQAMCRACFADKNISDHYDLCDFELTVFADFAGIYCKARPDAWDLKNNILYDLKTCREAKEDSFVNAVFNSGYHRQTSFYFNIISQVHDKPKAFKFWCVENAEPYATATYTMGRDFIEIADEQLYSSFKKYAEVSIEDKWEGYETNYDELAPKAWMFYKS